jgi:hypothetical protein
MLPRNEGMLGVVAAFSEQLRDGGECKLMRAVDWDFIEVGDAIVIATHPTGIRAYDFDCRRYFPCRTWSRGDREVWQRIIDLQRQ